MPHACPGLSRVLVALFAAAAAATPAGAQEACTSYTVQPGDTLGSIALAAYGALEYQLIYNANVELLRANPATPPVGTVLRIPCEDGRLSAGDAAPAVTTAAAAADPATADTSAPVDGAAAAYRPMIRIVSGDDWLPFADPKLTGGGLFSRIATTALDRAGPQYRHSIGWVEDWESHITALLPTGAFDLATGWYDPGCDTLVNPSERTLNICAEFLFSDPIYDSLFGFFMTPDNPYAGAKTFADLKGARLCRAEGNLFQDLEAQGLAEPEITISMEFDEEACLNGMLQGRYDVVSFEVQYAKVILGEMGITDEIVQSPNLTSIQSSVAIAYRGNPRARAYIDHLNIGLADLRASGEWTDLVTSSLAEAEALEAATGQ